MTSVVIECRRCGSRSKTFKSVEAASKEWTGLGLPRFQCPNCNLPAELVIDAVLFVEPGETTQEIG
jgi:hypothetical protein